MCRAVPSCRQRCSIVSTNRGYAKSWIAIDYIAIAIANVTVTVDPEVVLLDGGICREQQLLPLVNAALDRIPYWDSFRTVVKRCRHTNNADLIGAYYAFETEVEALLTCR
ncbi:ROK family protein [Bifidobacterium catenulatum]|uniref:ROK family protein n=1 Tax=Bifidobacterium catenulatum TaxID=1686 RepID=UPI003D2EFC5C